MRPLLVALAVLVCSIPVSTAQAFELGAGFRCSGTELSVRSRVLSLRRAQRMVDAAIGSGLKRLRTLKRRGAAVSALAAVRSRIASLRVTRRQLRACTSGKIAASAADLAAFLEVNAGSYAGQYDDALLGMSGPIALDVALSSDERVSGRIVLGGVYAMLIGPEPILFNRSISGVPFPLAIIHTGSSTGDLQLVLRADGAVSILLTNLPRLINGVAPRVSFDGMIGGGTVTGRYSVGVVGGTPILAGDVVLTR